MGKQLKRGEKKKKQKIRSEKEVYSINPFGCCEKHQLINQSPEFRFSKQLKWEIAWDDLATLFGWLNVDRKPALSYKWSNRKKKNNSIQIVVEKSDEKSIHDWFNDKIENFKNLMKYFLFFPFSKRNVDWDRIKFLVCTIQWISIRICSYHLLSSKKRRKKNNWKLSLYVIWCEIVSLLLFQWKLKETKNKQTRVT